MPVVSTGMPCIAIIGDLHYLDAAAHGLAPGSSRPPDAVREAADADRYHTFTERILPALLGEVAGARPDLVLHTGDLAETGYREPAGSRELRAGLEHLRGIGAPLLLCRGNHDGDRAYRDICGAHALPRWDGPGVHVFTLDYPEFTSPEQFARLEGELAATCVAAARTGARVLLAGHAPAHAVARPFFTDLPYAQAVASLAARHPIDAYFCGHTHNQAWSLHPLPGGRRLLQVKGAGVGFPGKASLPLAAERAICGGPAGCELLWGQLEDGTPGWNELVLDGEWSILRWHALGAGVQAEASWRTAGEVELVQPPLQATPRFHPGADAVLSARLHVAGYGGGQGRSIRVNGRVVGSLPALGSFAPRGMVPLPPDVLAARNRIEIETSPDDRLLVGALAIEVILQDGGAARTPVGPHLHATSDDWDAWGEPRLQRVPAGEPIVATLAFGG